MIVRDVFHETRSWSTTEFRENRTDEKSVILGQWRTDMVLTKKNRSAFLFTPWEKPKMIIRPSGGTVTFLRKPITVMNLRLQDWCNELPNYVVTSCATDPHDDKFIPE
jgi:hypothetical protein